MIRRHSAALRTALMLVDGALALVVVAVLSQARSGPTSDATWRQLFSVDAKLDLACSDRWSLWPDLKIALRTVPVLLRSEGR